MPGRVCRRTRCAVNGCLWLYVWMTRATVPRRMHVRNVPGPRSSRPPTGAQDPRARDPITVTRTPVPARYVHTGLAAGGRNVGAGSTRCAANCRSCRDGRTRGACGARGTAIDPQTGGLQSTRLQRDAQNPGALDPNAVSRIPEPARNVQTRLAANGRLVGVGSTRCAANGRSCRDRRGRGTFGTRDTTVGPQTGGPQSARPRRNVQDPGALDPNAVSRTPEPARHVQTRLAANGRPISVSTRCAANGRSSRDRMTRGSSPKTGGPQSTRPQRDAQDPGALNPNPEPRTPGHRTRLGRPLEPSTGPRGRFQDSLLLLPPPRHLQVRLQHLGLGAGVPRQGRPGGSRRPGATRGDQGRPGGLLDVLALRHLGVQRAVDPYQRHLHGRLDPIGHTLHVHQAAIR